MLSLRSEAFARAARMLRTALGPAIAGHLEDPGVVEVMLNPDGRLMASRFVTITAAPSWSSISRNRFSGMTPRYALVGEPKSNGVGDCFFRTRKEQVVHGRIFQTIEEVRARRLA